MPRPSIAATDPCLWQGLLGLLLVLVMVPRLDAQGGTDGSETPGLSLAGRRATEERRISGYTRASRRVQLSSELAGRLLSIDVAEGEVVPAPTDDAGTTVIARVEVEQLRLQLAAERVTLERAEADSRYEDAEFQRVERLRGLATQEQKLARQHSAELAALAVSAAKAAIARTEDRLGRAEIHAEPGLVMLRHLAQPGELMTVGRPLAELGDFRTLEVDFRLTEEEISALRAVPVLSLEMQDPDSPEDMIAIEATRAHVFPEFDLMSRKRRAEITIDAADLPEASGGLRMELTLRVLDPSGAWRVPLELVETRYDETFVHTSAGPISVAVLRRQDGELIVLAPELDESSVLHAPR